MKGGIKMEKSVEIKAIAQYGGHSMKPNGVTELMLKFDYSELTDIIMLQQMLNNDISIIAKMPNDSKAMKLGVFKIKSTNIASDGCSNVRFFSSVDFVESDNLNKLVTTDQFKIRCNANIEIEEEGENENA